MKDNKYIVFKREEWDHFIRGLDVDHAESIGLTPLGDAVVIRTKDPLAGPALHAYAAGAALPARVFHLNGSPEGRALQDVADYFHERAVEADEYAAANPVKLPD